MAGRTPTPLKNIQAGLGAFSAEEQKIILSEFLRRDYAIDPDLPDTALTPQQLQVKNHVLGMTTPNPAQTIDTGSTLGDLAEGVSSTFLNDHGLTGWAKDAAGLPHYPESTPGTKAAAIGRTIGSTLNMATDLPFMAGNAAGGPAAGMAASGGVNTFVDMMRQGKPATEALGQSAIEAGKGFLIGKAGQVAGALAGKAVTPATNILRAETNIIGPRASSIGSQVASGIDTSAKAIGEGAGFTAGDVAEKAVRGQAITADDTRSSFANNLGMSLTGMMAHAAGDRTKNAIAERTRREGAGTRAQQATMNLQELGKAVGVDVGPNTADQAGLIEAVKQVSDPAALSQFVAGLQQEAAKEGLGAEQKAVFDDLIAAAQQRLQEVTPPPVAAQVPVPPPVDPALTPHDGQLPHPPAPAEAPRLDVETPPAEPPKPEAIINREVPPEGIPFRPEPAFQTQAKATERLPLTPDMAGHGDGVAALRDRNLTSVSDETDAMAKAVTPKVHLDIPTTPLIPEHTQTKPGEAKAIGSGPVVASGPKAPGTRDYVGREAVDASASIARERKGGYDKPGRPMRVRQNVKTGTIEVEFRDDVAKTDEAKAARDSLKGRGFKKGKDSQVWSKKYNAAEWAQVKREADALAEKAPPADKETEPTPVVDVPAVEAPPAPAQEPTKKEAATATLKAKSKKQPPKAEAPEQGAQSPIEEPKAIRKINGGEETSLIDAETLKEAEKPKGLSGEAEAFQKAALTDAKAGRLKPEQVAALNGRKTAAPKPADERQGGLDLEEKPASLFDEKAARTEAKKDVKSAQDEVNNWTAVVERLADAAEAKDVKEGNKTQWSAKKILMAKPSEVREQYFDKMADTEANKALIDAYESLVSAREMRDGKKANGAADAKAEHDRRENAAQESARLLKAMDEAKAADDWEAHAKLEAEYDALQKQSGNDIWGKIKDIWQDEWGKGNVEAALMGPVAYPALAVKAMLAWFKGKTVAKVGFKDVAEAKARLKELTTPPKETEAIKDVKAGTSDAPRSGKPPELLINLDRFDVEKAIRQVLAITAAMNHDAIMEAKGGKVALEETERLADLLGMPVDKILSRKKGEVFNHVEITAARKVLAASADKVLQLSEKISGDKVDDGDMADFVDAVTLHRAIQAQVLGASAEAARALSANRIHVKSEAQRMKQIERILEDFGGRDQAVKAARMINDLAKNEGADAANKLLGKWAPNVSLARIQSYWMNNILSGVTTHGANTLSNAITLAGKVGERYMAAGLSKLYREADGATFGEANAEAYAAMTTLGEAWTAARRTWKTGDSKFDLGGEMGASEHKAGAGIFEKPTRALMAEDEFFKTMNFRMEMHRVAYRGAAKQADERGLTGKERTKYMADLIPDLMDENGPLGQKTWEAAYDEAQYRTFNSSLGKSDTVLAKGGQAIMKLRREKPAMAFLVPFVRTPVNIMLYANERMPHYAMTKAYRNEILAGGQRASMARAKVVMGNMVVGGVLAAAMAGVITGAGPADKEKRKTMELNGWRPYSVKLGSTYVSYSRLAPLAILMGAAANFVEGFQDPGNASRFDQLANATFGTMKIVMSQTYLKGMSDMALAMTDFQRYGPNMLASIAGGFVPYSGMASNAATLIDPKLKMTSSLGGTDKELSRPLSRIPFVRDMLPDRIDAFGETITQSRASSILPVNIAFAKGSKTADELVRLGVNLPEPKNVYKGAEIPGETYEDWATKMGKDMKQRLDRLVESPGYDNLEDTSKAKRLKFLIKTVHTRHNRTLKREMQELSSNED